METIYITGLGMVTSLGHDVITSCAAARAGIVRPSKRDDFPVRSPEDGSVGALVVHAVPMLTEGFEGQARLQRLMTAGLKDLIRQTPHAPWKQGRAAFYLSLPDPRRIYTGFELIPNEEERKEKEKEAREVRAEPLDDSWAHTLLAEAAQLSGWSGKSELRFIATSGNTGVAQALEKAIVDLDAGKIDVAIVGGVDSLLDEEILVWLESTLRLKTPDMPTGLQPGEAAAFFTVETARQGGLETKALGRIQAVYMGMEPSSLFSGEPPVGEGLAMLMDKTAQSAGIDKSETPWFIADQNGESYRAMEWGHALVRLIHDWPGLDNAVLWYPAMSFGDTGAANGVVAICIAVRAFERGYAPAYSVNVIASSETAYRGMIRISLSQ
jgi:3-oxoacyl-(acyl-carrier-protein) synthase